MKNRIERPTLVAGIVQEKGSWKKKKFRVENRLLRGRGATGGTSRTHPTTKEPVVTRRIRNRKGTVKKKDGPKNKPRSNSETKKNLPAEKELSSRGPQDQRKAESWLAALHLSFGELGKKIFKKGRRKGSERRLEVTETSGKSRRKRTGS